MTDTCSRRRTRSGNSVIDVPTSPLVMPGLVRPGIHVLGQPTKDVDGRDVGAKQIFVASPGHDEPRPGRREISNSPIHAHTSAFSRRGASESCQTTALIERAQGMPGARCARSLACKMKKHTSVVTTVTPETPGIPRTMVLTVSFVISSVIGLGCHRRLRFVSASLTPASR